MEPQIYIAPGPFELETGHTLPELRIAYHLIQYLEDFSRNAVGDCAAAQPVKFSLRGGSRGDRAFLLSTLLHCLKLLRRYECGVDLRSDIAAVFQNSSHHVYVPVFACIVRNIPFIEFLCEMPEGCTGEVRCIDVLHRFCFIGGGDDIPKLHAVAEDHFSLGCHVVIFSFQSVREVPAR